MRATGRRRLSGAAASLLLLTACAGAGSQTERTEPRHEGRETQPEGAPKTHETSRPGAGPKAPPPVTVEYSGRSATLEPWTYCYDAGCADGAPPRRPLDVGSPDEVVVTYPLPGWSFEATFTPAGEECGRAQRRSLEEVGDGRYLLRPAGYAGAYDVTLFGRGDGDLSVTFRWTTPTDGPLPRPRAYLGVVTDSDDRIVSYGVEMSISNLAEDPETVHARVTVTARDESSISFVPRMSRGPCLREGSLYWDGPTRKGHAAARLGEPPFTYEVDLTLDGRTYRGHGVWPDDEIRGSAPYVRLEFEPDLPSLVP